MSDLNNSCSQDREGFANAPMKSGRIRVDRKAPTQKIELRGKIATRAAVEEGIVAGGVVALLVTTEAMIAEAPKKEAAGGGMPGGMGDGMGGMDFPAKGRSKGRPFTPLAPPALRATELGSERTQLLGVIDAPMRACARCPAP